MIAAQTMLMDQWAQIHNRECPLHLEQREPPLSDATLAAMLALEPHMRRFEGDPKGVRAAFADLPSDLVADVEALSRRFAQVMNVSAVRVRIERTDSNACRKVHADYTDVRLITTYAGPGTDIAPHADENDRSDCCLERVPTGWVGLFKGRTYDADHRPCYHRSPPAGDMGEKRLVLVIDTPLDPRTVMR
jgi:Protein of unknown function (DUF1826)